MKRTREKTQRKFFSGGKMLDGLELYPLTINKQEILGEWLQGEDADEDDLGRVALYVYAHRFSQLESIESFSEAVELAEQWKKEADPTTEDVLQASEVIKADFEAIAASNVESVDSGKEQAGEQVPSPMPSPASTQLRSA